MEQLVDYSVMTGVDILMSYSLSINNTQYTITRKKQQEEQKQYVQQQQEQ